MHGVPIGPLSVPPGCARTSLVWGSPTQHAHSDLLGCASRLSVRPSFCDRPHGYARRFHRVLAGAAVPWARTRHPLYGVATGVLRPELQGACEETRTRSPSCLWGCRSEEG